jgi:TonB family protein
MSRTLLRALLCATVLVLRPLPVNSQRPAQLLADARKQIGSQHLDSAIALLHAVTMSHQADSSERAEAHLWLGVATYFTSSDSAVSNAFRDALAIDPLMTPTALLAQLDSGLAALWEREQTSVLCGETLPAWRPSPTNPMETAPLNSDARAAQGPKIVSGPQVPYPDNLQRARIHGRVLVRVVIDTSGRAQRGSVHVLSTAHPDFNPVAIKYAEHADYTAAVSSAGRVRSCFVLPIEFRLAH